MQNLAALAAAATATQGTPTGSSTMTTSSSPLSALTNSGKIKSKCWERGEVVLLTKTKLLV